MPRPGCDALQRRQRGRQAEHRRTSGPSTPSGRRTRSSRATWPAASPRSRCCPARPTSSAAAAWCSRSCRPQSVQGMKFPGAQYGLKMACGENPKRVYGDKGGPQTRMGNVAGYRQAWIDAEAYRRALGQLPRQSGQGGPARPRPRQGDARRGAARQHPRPEPLLSRRRDDADDRHREGVRLLHPVVPPRGRGVQDRRRARARLDRRLDVGRLGRLQDGGARRHPGQRWRWSTTPAPAPSSTPTTRPAPSASTRRPPRRWPPAAPSASTSPRTRRSSG